MICPKCKTQNSDEAVFCAHCGFKLKTICPKCKMTNALNAPKCSNCGLRLIRFCPNCQTPNTPISEKCKKCAAPLLKKCSKCNAINPLSASHCKKCNALLEDKSIDFSPKSNILIELSNGSILNEKISPKELAEKLIKKFFQTVLLILKPYELKALKVSTFAIGTEFDTIDDEKSIKIAQEILSEFQTLNEKLAHTHLSYELKIFISQALSIKHRFGSDLLPKVSTNIICTDAAVAMSQKDSYNFAPVAPGIYEIKEQKEITEAAASEQTLPPQEEIKTPLDIEAIAVEQELQAEPPTEIQQEPQTEPQIEEVAMEEPSKKSPNNNLKNKAQPKDKLHSKIFIICSKKETAASYQFWENPESAKKLS
jgi:ribosomal protein L40E